MIIAGLVSKRSAESCSALPFYENALSVMTLEYSILPPVHLWTSICADV